MTQRRKVLDPKVLDLRQPSAHRKERKFLASFRSHYKVLIGGGVFVALILIGLAAFALWRAYSSAGPIPQNIRKQLKIPLYYPSRLPSGYSVDRSSITTRDGVLIFNIKSQFGKTIGVSEEPVPTDLSLQEIRNAPINLPGEKDFYAPAGHAHIGLWSDKYVADIVGDGTWIIINVSGYTANQATAITQAFTKLQ